MAADGRAFLDTNVLVYVFDTRDEMKHERAKALLREIPGRSPVVSARCSASSSIACWDALIVKAASVSLCDRILTEDLNDGQVIDGVSIADPFRG